MIVAIDGPAGSGKGTITKLVAERLNLIYIDSGATYRCVALACLRNSIGLNEKDKIIKLTKTLDIDFDVCMYIEFNNEPIPYTATEEVPTILPKRNWIEHLLQCTFHTLQSLFICSHRTRC